MEDEQDLEAGGVPLLVPVDESVVKQQSSLTITRKDSFGLPIIDCSTAHYDDDDDCYDDDGCSVQDEDSDFYYRRILPVDRREVQALHEEWFPVTYTDEFYDELVQERLAGEPLYTCIAVPRQAMREQDASIDAEQPSSPDLPVDQVAACVVGSFLPTSRLSVETRSLLISNRQRYTRMFYIMTLGTVTDYRQAGLGTILIERCMRQVESDKACGVLYLHVITFNEAAIRFYEKLGFYRVEEIANYYSIDGKMHGCYLYAKYYHGNRGHRDPYKILTRALSAVWRQLKAPLSLLVDFSSVPALPEDDC